MQNHSSNRTFLPCKYMSGYLFPNHLTHRPLKVKLKEKEKKKERPAFISWYQKFLIRSDRSCACCGSSKRYYEPKSKVAVADHRFAIPKTLFLP